MASKYGAVAICEDGYRFASKAEARRYGELRQSERAGAIAALEVHPRYVLQEAFLSHGEPIQAIHYEADFAYTEGERRVVEDVKGVATAVFKLKAKMFRLRYPELEFRVVPA